MSVLFEEEAEGRSTQAVAILNCNKYNKCWKARTIIACYHPGQATAVAQAAGISHTSAGGNSARKLVKDCHIQLAIHGTP